VTFLDWIYFENTVRTWLLALLVAIVAMLILRIAMKLIIRRAIAISKRTETDIDDLVAHLLENTKFLFLLVMSLYAGSLVLTLPQKATRLVNSVAVIALLVQSAIWVNELLSYWIIRYERRKKEEDPSSVTVVTALGFIGRIVLWSVILLLALDNLGVNITALIAGLGIGGIAIGLALQNILGDLFSSLSIVLDKPFVIGDFIAVDNYLGSVEHIGLKTTRVRSLSGEELIFPNSDLTRSRIHNYKSLSERLVVFSIGVVYETPYEKLAAIPGMIQEIIEGQDQIRFDRAHFKDYGDFSLNFEIVYHVLNPDYNLYMDIQQAINLAILRRFNEEGVEFAYPTQTLFVNNEPVPIPAGN
jgi:small-conductance mechanosensitive channel